MFGDHPDLHSFPTRRSSDLRVRRAAPPSSEALSDALRVRLAQPLETPAVDDVTLRLDNEGSPWRSEEHTSELQSHHDLVCRLLLEKKNNDNDMNGFV